MGKESGDKGDWGKGDNSAGSFKQFVGVRNRAGIELSLPARQSPNFLTFKEPNN